MKIRAGLGLVLLAACHRPEHTVFPSLPAPPGAAWTELHVERDLEWSGPDLLTHWGWVGTSTHWLKADVGGKPWELRLLTDRSSNPEATLDHVRRMAFQLRASPDGKAVGVSADGKVWREVRFDLGPQPFYCPHFTFAGEAWPTALERAVDLLSPEHEQAHHPLLPVVQGAEAFVAERLYQCSERSGPSCHWLGQGDNPAYAYLCAHPEDEASALLFAQSYAGPALGFPAEAPACAAALARRHEAVRALLVHAPDPVPHGGYDPGALEASRRLFAVRQALAADLAAGPAAMPDAGR